jgi:hypothetical protein
MQGRDGKTGKPGGLAVSLRWIFPYSGSQTLEMYIGSKSTRTINEIGFKEIWQR